MDVKSEIAVPVDADTNSSDQGWVSFAWFLVKVVIAVLVLRIFIISLFSIPSESMLPNLMKGDYLVASKWSYGWSRHSLPFDVPLGDGRILARQPERGDIAIFKHPIDETDYVKRVIGLPGDTVAIQEGMLTINGVQVERRAMPDLVIEETPNTACSWGGRTSVDAEGRSLCTYRRFDETLPGGVSHEVLEFGLSPGDQFGPRIIPEGHVFVMGDNRDNSRDSRFPASPGDAVGIVSQDFLVGKAIVIVWSTDGSAEWVKPWTWFTAMRWSRIGNLL